MAQYLVFHLLPLFPSHMGSNNRPYLPGQHIPVDSMADSSLHWKLLIFSNNCKEAAFVILGTFPGFATIALQNTCIRNFIDMMLKVFSIILPTLDKQ